MLKKNRGLYQQWALNGFDMIYLRTSWDIIDNMILGGSIIEFVVQPCFGSLLVIIHDLIWGEMINLLNDLPRLVRVSD